MNFLHKKDKLLAWSTEGADGWIVTLNCHPQKNEQSLLNYHYYFSFCFIHDTMKTRKIVNLP